MNQYSKHSNHNVVLVRSCANDVVFVQNPTLVMHNNMTSVSNDSNCIIHSRGTNLAKSPHLLIYLLSSFFFSFFFHQIYIHFVFALINYMRVELVLNFFFSVYFCVLFFCLFLEIVLIGVWYI